MGNKYTCIDCIKAESNHVEFDIYPKFLYNNLEIPKYDNKHVKSAKLIQDNYRRFKSLNKLIQILFIIIEERMNYIEVISIEDIKEQIDENKLKILNNFEEEIKANNKNKSRINRINFGAMSFSDNKEFYLGEWNLKGEKSGLGTFIMQDNSIYYGYFEKDLFEGKGIFINDDGYYYGEWKNGKINGYGILKYFTSSAEYKGNWKDNFKEGYGEEKYEDGSYYQGNFRLNEKDGEGKYVWPNGSKYSGHFKNSTLEGKGIFKWKDSRSYEGFWKGNKFHGHGIHTWPNGSYYDGNYMHGKKSGEGVYCWKNDIYYNGQWLNNYQHGEGTFTIKNTYNNGSWRFGKMIRNNEITNIDGIANNNERNDTFYDTPFNTCDEKSHTRGDSSYILKL